MTERLHGELKTWFEPRGFGFIVPDDGGKDVFVLGRVLRQAGIPFPRAGMRLSFDVQHDEQGRSRAADVQLDGAAAEAERAFKHEPVRP